MNREPISVQRQRFPPHQNWCPILLTSVHRPKSGPREVFLEVPFESVQPLCFDLGLITEPSECELTSFSLYREPVQTEPFGISWYPSILVDSFGFRSDR